MISRPSLLFPSTRRVSAFSRAAVFGLAFAEIVSAPARGQDWDLRITPYLWGAAIDGTTVVGPLTAETSVDFSDIVNVLSGAALVRFEAQKGEHGFFTDLTFLSLEADDARSTDGSRIDLELDSLIVEGAYVYRLSERNAVELGARYWDFETTLTPTLLAARSQGKAWTDGFIGFRSEAEIAANWTWLLRVNFGAGGSDLAAGLQADFRRPLASGNSVDIGYRALVVDYESGAGERAVALDMALHGLTIGFSFD